MVQVAEVVGVHETTVSRAVSGKYMQTPQGIFEMKYFFTSGIQTANGDGMSNTSVKDMIAEIFKNEDPTKPLSDQEVVKMLQGKGHRHRPPHRRQIPHRTEHPAVEPAQGLLVIGERQRGLLMNDLIRFLIVSILLNGAVLVRVDAQLPTAPVDKPVVVPSPVTLPEWPRPKAFVPGPDSPTIRSGDLEVTYGESPLDGFLLHVNGRLMGVGCPPLTFGYVHSNEVHWLHCEPAPFRSRVSRSSVAKSTFRISAPTRTGRCGE